MSKYRQWSDVDALNDIDARLTALEEQPARRPFDPEAVLVKMYERQDAVKEAAANYEKAANQAVPDALPASGASDEEASTIQERPTVTASDEETIKRVRAKIKGHYLLFWQETEVLLAAYDRVTRERDEYSSSSYLAAYTEARRTIEQRDARIAELEGERDDAVKARVAWQNGYFAQEKRIAEMEGQLADVQKNAERIQADLYQFEEIAANRHDTIQRLESQLAARADAKPLGWVNVYKYGGVFFESAENAKREAAGQVLRIAVPVHEHPPAEGARVSDEPPQEFTDWLGREMPQNTVIGDPTWWAPRIWRAAVRHVKAAPALRVVGACVVRDGVLTFGTMGASFGGADKEAKLHAKDGGTAHWLVVGEVIK